jgi:hypothetical protein
MVDLHLLQRDIFREGFLYIKKTTGAGKYYYEYYNTEPFNDFFHDDVINDLGLVGKDINNSRLYANLFCCMAVVLVTR